MRVFSGGDETNGRRRRGEGDTGRIPGACRQAVSEVSDRSAAKDRKNHTDIPDLRAEVIA